jgi:hypothetical protein
MEAVVPAFFTAHLRRCFAKKMKVQLDSQQEANTNLRSEPAQESISGQQESEQPPQTDPVNGSKFSLKECRQYAQHLHKTGQGITNPGGYATTIFRTGEADSWIEEFLHPTAVTKPTNISLCPDCQGTGLWYPHGFERGAAKCKHEKLISH